MPRKVLHCEKAVKSHFVEHLKCSKYCSPRMVNSEILNITLGSSAFNNHSEYRVCRTLYDSRLSHIKPSNIKSNRKRTLDELLDDYLKPPPNSSPREIRQMKRIVVGRGGPIDTCKIKGVKIAFDEEEHTINYTSRVGHKIKYSHDILSAEPKYKKKFADLKMRERLRRMEHISKLVLACCVDRVELEKDGHKYLRGNDILATAVIDFLDGVKEKIQNEMQMNFANVANDVTLPVSGDIDGHIDELDGNKDKLAIAILGHSSKNGFMRLRKVMPDSIKNKKYDKLTKYRPVVLPFNLDLIREEIEQSFENITVNSDNMDDNTF